MRSHEFGDIVGAFSISLSRFKPHLPTPLRWLALVWTSVICLQVVDAAEGSHPSTYSRLTRALRVDSNSPQTVGLLLSIREKLYEISEKQKQDVTPSRVFNDLDVISHRLQNIEEQISRAESYNKMRLEQLMESAMKSEVLIDQLARRVEKNNQNINSRLSDMDKFLENATKIQQENMEKIIRKIELQQDNMASARYTAPINFSQTTPTRINIQPQQIFNNNAERETGAGSASESGANVVDDDKVSGNGETFNDTNLPKSVSFANQSNLTSLQKFVRNESNRIVSVMNEKYGRLEQQAEFLNNSLDECVSLVNKIYAKIGDQKIDETNHFDSKDILESLIVQINAQNVRNADKLEMMVKSSIDDVLRQQRIFSSNCHRLQSNEDQLEDKVIAILQNLMDYIDDQNERVQRNCQALVDSQRTHDDDRNDFDQELIAQNLKRTNTKIQPEPIGQSQPDKNIKNTEVTPPTSNPNISSSASNTTTKTKKSVLRVDSEIVSKTETNIPRNLTQFDAGDDAVPHSKILAYAADENVQHQYLDADVDRNAKFAALRARLRSGASASATKLRTEISDQDWTEETLLSNDAEYDDRLVASDNSDDFV